MESLRLSQRAQEVALTETDNLPALAGSQAESSVAQETYSSSTSSRLARPAEGEEDTAAEGNKPTFAANPDSSRNSNGFETPKARRRLSIDTQPTDQTLLLAATSAAGLRAAVAPVDLPDILAREITTNSPLKTDYHNDRTAPSSPSHANTPSSVASGSLTGSPRSKRVAVKNIDAYNAAEKTPPIPGNLARRRDSAPNNSQSHQRTSSRDNGHTQNSAKDSPRSTDQPRKRFESNKQSSQQQSAITSTGSRRQLGEWTLGKTLGAGSMGKVKLAVSNVTGEKVTLFLFCLNYALCLIRGVHDARWL